MAGIVFPDVAGAVLPALQVQNAQTRNAFEMDRMRRADEADMREQAVAKDIPAALAGDKDALGRVAAVPKYALAIAPMIERMDARHQALLKGFSEWQTKAAMAMANAPPEQKVATHQAALAEGRQLGFGNFLTDMPEQYSPSVDARWKYHLDKAEPVAEYFKRLADQPQPMGGGAPGAAPTAAPGGVDSAGNAIAGIESKGAPNGGYGAVGPVANDKGSRAYGKYQVMDFNIPQWTAEILGKPMTPQEFLANPQAQDAVFKGKFGQYVQQAGGDQQKAAQMWFAGPGGANNPGAADVNGMTVQKYGQQFVANGGAGPQANGPPVSLAGGQVPPGAPMPQGGDQPTGNQPGVMPGMPQTVAPNPDILRQVPLPPGSAFALRKGQNTIKDGMIEIINPDKTLGWVKLPAAPPPGYEPRAGGGGLQPIPGGPHDSKGPFAGNNLDAQSMNILLTGEPNTPEYAAAYAKVAEPKQAAGGQLMYPDMSAYRKPQGAGGVPIGTGEPHVQDTPQSRFQMSGKLADDFNQLKPVKAYREVVPIMQSMQDAAGRNNRVADLNLVYGLAKIMDPESVVREGEQVMVRNAQSLPDWLRGMINTVNGGSAFIPAQRARILEEAQSRVGAIKGQFDSIAGQFSDRAKRYGLNPEDVLTVPSNQPAEKERGAQAGTYLAPGGRPVNMNEIEETAKNRGMTPDEVIKRLNLKPAGK